MGKITTIVILVEQEHTRVGGELVRERTVYTCTAPDGRKYRARYREDLLRRLIRQYGDIEVVSTVA